jgi:CubicO group peptidase (beta-lactamase class C family)
MIYRTPLRLLISQLILVIAPVLLAQEPVPGEFWQYYQVPAEAGFSAEKLQEAQDYYASIDAAGALIIYDGAILAAWGDVERRYMCHSIRKSFMSGLMGVHVDRGEIDLSLTLADLGIDDLEPKLSEVEKRATILDLLKARSGVYRLAAYEPPQNRKPPRYSHDPGTYWCYNNWDFNTLLTIFQQILKVDFFADFDRQIAQPIGMQDYRPRDGYLHYELDKSIHPAYPFRMSALDMARFGLLYLREGNWGGKQILSKEWVQRSRTPYSENGRGGGYGLLWWTANGQDMQKLGMYSALGFGGHAIDVIPGANLVVVLRVDTFAHKKVTGAQRMTLLRKILAANEGRPSDQPQMLVYQTTLNLSRIDPVTFPANDLRPARPLEQYTGELAVPHLGDVRVHLVAEDQLGVFISTQGDFDLIPMGGDLFQLADMGRNVVLEVNSQGQLVDFVNQELTDDIGLSLMKSGKLKLAQVQFEKNVRLFPDSAKARTNLRKFEAYRAKIGAPSFATIEDTLNTLYQAVSFEAGQECDWDKLERAFLPGAIVVQKNAASGQFRVQTSAEFIAMIRVAVTTSSLKESGFHERILHRITEQVGNTAHAYVTFQAYTSELDPSNLEASGVDSIQFVRTKNRWWIAALTTQRATPETPIAAKFLPKDE